MRTALLVGALVLAGSIGCRVFEPQTMSAPSPPLLPGQSTAVFTTARPTVGAALNDFFWVEREPEQPLEFPHDIHAGKQIACTDYCHEAVTTGPVAGLPSVRTCLVCHSTIATDRPRIRQLTAMR